MDLEPTRWFFLCQALLAGLLGLTACRPPPPAVLPPTVVVSPAASHGTATPTAANTLDPTATRQLSPTRTPPPTDTPQPQTGERSAGDPYAPELGNSGYDVQHYDLALTIDPGVTYLEGTAAITAVSRLHNLVEFSLDFSGFEIERLTLDGEEAEYSRADGKLIIRPPAPLVAGQVFEISVKYAGVPEQIASPYVPFFHHLGIQYLGETAFTYNQPGGAHFWYPSNDHPSDKATYSFALTVPQGLTAVANGTQTGFETGEGAGTYFWEHPYPMASYLAMVAVGEYDIVDGFSPGGIPLRHYVFPDIRQPFDDATAVTGEALDWMAAFLGPYPYEQFGFVTTRLIRASLETQGNVLLSEQMLNEETIVHEIAHMWFGDWVTMASWADMWHNEGFAVYLSLMWQTRERPGALNVFMQNLEARVGRESSADPLGNLSPNLLFGFDSYQRGALMIHNLRETVGEEAFFEALRTYLERYGGGVATRQDFIDVFEETSGMELGEFFEEWLGE